MLRKKSTGILYKTTFDRNLLHNLHGQFSGFYSFFFQFEILKAVNFLMQSGTISQILGSKKYSKQYVV